MSRWVWFTLCAILGLVMLICGLLVPMHLRAVDAGIIQRAARRTPALVDQGLALVNDKKQLGAAQLLFQAAQQERLPNREKLGLAITNLAAQHPTWLAWGGSSEYHLQVLFQTDPGLPKSGSEPFTEWAVRLENRGTVLELLRTSSRPVVQELLRCRSLTHTAIFSPSDSASGQAFDAALSVCGLLAEERKLTTGLSDTILALATQANHGGNSEPLEGVLLDLMSLGQRLNWSQMAVFVSQIRDAGTLRLLTEQVRRTEGQLPVLFSAVYLSGQPPEVAKYLMTYSQTGLKDLGSSLRSGAGGVRELVQRNQRLYTSDLRQHLAGYAPFDTILSVGLDYSWLMPWLALSVKWLLYLAGGFLLAMAIHFTWPAASTLERPLQVRGFHIVREILFALGFLLVVLLLSEPFLAQESQRAEFSPFRLRLPTVGGIVPAGITLAKSSLMNQLTLLTMLLFFVLQALLYTACLVKLAEIRRQQVPPRIKLKLLENEDHLFDAGLYLGFVGTIISLILVSLGVIKQPSLMAAYSSTSFGIIFVSIFKIFHLRPTRRKIVLEAEATYPETTMPAGSARLATPS